MVWNTQGHFTNLNNLYYKELEYCYVFYIK